MEQHLIAALVFVTVVSGLTGALFGLASRYESLKRENEELRIQRDTYAADKYVGDQQRQLKLEPEETNRLRELALTFRVGNEQALERLLASASERVKEAFENWQKLWKIHNYRTVPESSRQ